MNHGFPSGYFCFIDSYILTSMTVIEYIQASQNVKKMFKKRTIQVIKWIVGLLLLLSFAGADDVAFDGRIIRFHFALAVGCRDKLLEQHLDSERILKNRRVLQMIVQVRLG